VRQQTDASECFPYLYPVEDKDACLGDTKNTLAGCRPDTQNGSAFSKRMMPLMPGMGMRAAQSELSVAPQSAAISLKQEEW
jgi:hypothetical protein